MSANRLKLNTDKTELISTGTRSNLERIPGGGVSVTLGNDVIPVAEAVRVLGVVITPDLWLDKHVTALSVKCLFQLQQLRRVRRSLDDASVATGCTPSLPVGLTTATVCSPGQRRRR